MKKQGTDDYLLTKEVSTLRKREMVMLWIEKIVYCVKIFIVLETLC